MLHGNSKPVLPYELAQVAKVYAIQNRAAAQIISRSVIVASFAGCDGSAMKRETIHRADNGG